MSTSQQPAPSTATTVAPAGSALPQSEGAALVGTILVVDDDPAIAELLSVTLRRQGYRVQTAGDAHEALELARHEPPELLLVDLVMPGVDGLELVTLLREQVGLATTPVIFVSALHDPASKARGFAHGGVDYLTKPFRGEELVARVRSHLQLHRARCELETRERQLEELLGEVNQEVLASEQALNRRTAQVDALFAAIPDVVFVTDPDGVYLDGNTQLERLLGRSLEDIVGRTDAELFPGHLGQVLTDRHACVLAEDRPVVDEHSVPTADGGEVLLETITVPVRGPDDSLLGVLGVGRDITDRHGEREALRRSQSALLHAQEVAELGSWEVDLRTGEMTWSEQTYRLLDVDPQHPVSPDEVLSLVHVDDRDRVRQALRSALQGGPEDVEHRLARRPQGWVRQRARVERAADGTPLQMIGTVLDITAAKQHERDLEQEQQRLQDALETARAAAFEWDVPSDMLRPSQRWLSLLGYDLDRDGPVTAQAWLTWVYPAQLPAMRDGLERLLAGHDERHEMEFRLQHRDGRWLWLRGISRVTHWLPDGAPRTVRGLIIDITHEKAHQEQLSFVAEHDGLTGLINRQRFSDHVRDELLTNRGPQERLAVVCLDLDAFEEINQVHGRGAGNQLLVEIATRLLRCVGDRHRVARIGGDEFAVAVPVSGGSQGWRDAVEELYDAVTRPITLQGRSLQATASIGVTLHPQNRDADAEQLLRQADQAVYQAKLAGKDRYHLFDTEHDANRRERYQLIDEVHAALSDEQFVLYYQPQVNMHTGEVLGFESLIRWQHPERGLLPPGAFIPQLAGHPLSVELGDWVIEEALAQLARWRAAGMWTTVTVNIDTSQLYDPTFGARLEAQLAAEPEVDPTQLGIEILETGALEDLDHVAQLVRLIRNLGVSVALDDFGTGYSSLTLLKRLAANVVKIDRSFVMELLGDPEHALIIDSVVGLARNFERLVLAEGVETVEHGSLLLELGCELAQGFGIARPMPADQVWDWAERWQPPQEWRHVDPMPADRMPAMLAEIEHRVWLQQLRAYLTGVRPTPPALEPTKCRLGTWLERVRQEHDAAPIGDLIEQHLALHAIAERLVQPDPSPPPHGASPTSLAADGLEQLEVQSRELLAQLVRWRHA